MVYVCSFFLPLTEVYIHFEILTIMRYVLGVFVLYSIGFSGGDILIASLCMGIAYGFIDIMKQGKI